MHGKVIKISKNSITIKDENGKTCGVVRNVISLHDIQPNKQIEYYKMLKEAKLNTKISNKKLRSYKTIIAVIDHETDTLYDFLRYVYGYTATSAHHIAKFNHDYCNGSWGCENRLTYREV